MMGKPFDTKPQYVIVNVGLLVFVISRPRIEVGGPPHQRGVVHPELSGLVLSLVDHAGRAQNGFLQTTDVYNLKLNSDLVVLSACQTALGKELRGEGLVGLTRAFMYAGSPRVVASLWTVPDVSTAELMTRFYKGMLVNGLRPAAALRQAQISIWREQRWARPYYWAAFILQGEWR